MNGTDGIFKKIEIEEFIWVVYLVIIGLSFYANGIERKYYQYNDLNAKETSSL